MILAFISLFKASDVLLTLMANPFYLEIGFSKSQIAWVSGTFGFIVTFVGSYLRRHADLPHRHPAGPVDRRRADDGLEPDVRAAGLGRRRAMPLFHVAILIENVSGGMGTTAFVAYLASLCNRRYTAVQYALLTSFMQMLGKFVIVPSSGFLVDALGWITVLRAVDARPACRRSLCLWWLGRHVHAPAAAAAPAE